MNLTSNETGNTSSNFTGDNEGADDKHVLGIIYLVVSVLVMTANGVVVFVIVRTRELHLPTLWVITNMAVWDFCYGLSFLVYAVPSAFLNRSAYSEKCTGWAAVTTIIVQQNSLNTAMTIMDRAIAVKFPLKYQMMATKKKYLTALVVTVLVNLSRMPDIEADYIENAAICNTSFKTAWGHSVTVLVMLSSFSTIIFCLALILREVKLGKKQVHEVSSQTPKQTMSKSSLMVVISAGVYCAAFIPGIVLTIVKDISKDKTPFRSWLPQVVIVSNLSNSLWNVFIYTATYTPFRDALLSIFCKSYHRRMRQAEIQAEFRNRRKNVEITLHI